MGPPITRTEKKKTEQAQSSSTLAASASSQEHLNEDEVPLVNFPDDTADGAVGDDPQDATPRRNQRCNPPVRRRAEAPNIEDVLTQLTQDILTMETE